MAQGEKRENSVLFSLRELRQIEEKRVQEEGDAVRNAEISRMQAKEAAEREAREAEEARVRNAAEEERRIRETAENRSREEQMRLQEAENRARVEANAQLEQQRLQHEMDIRRQEASKKRPTWLLAVAGFLVLAISGVGFMLYRNNQENQRIEAEKQAQQKLLAEKEKALRDQEAQMAAIQAEVGKMQADMQQMDKDLDAANSGLASARTDADRQKAQDQIAAISARKQQTARSLENKQKEINKRQIKIDPKCLANALAPGC